MAENSGIQWCRHTWNHIRGCQRVSPGCEHCYAETMSGRNHATLGLWGPKGTRVLAAVQAWRQVEKWDRAARRLGVQHLVFCASLSDVFEDWDGQVSDSKENLLWWHPSQPLAYPTAGPSRHEMPPGDSKDWQPYTLHQARARLFDLIRRTPNLIYQLLTKRPENIGRMMPAGDWENVWLGTTVENQEYTWRADALKEAPQKVPVRFLSCEPLLGPITLWEQLQGIDWVIIGGESGSQSREMRIEWVRSLITQCDSENVRTFVKQMGRVATLAAHPFSAEAGLSTQEESGRFRLDLVHDRGHGGDERDWPDDIQVRQFPNCYELAQNMNP